MPQTQLYLVATSWNIHFWHQIREVVQEKFDEIKELCDEIAIMI